MTATWLRTRSLGIQAAAVGLGALALVLCAQIRIPLPFTPVPITMQTFGVVLIAAWLGRMAVPAVALYLLAGLAGAPVFSGWLGGMVHLAGPTGGYLVGMVLAAWVAGAMFEKAKGFGSTLTASLVGMGCIYAVGVPWLGVLVGWQASLTLGLIPFLAADVVKAAMVATLAARR